MPFQFKPIFVTATLISALAFAQQSSALSSADYFKFKLSPTPVASEQTTLIADNEVPTAGETDKPKTDKKRLFKGAGIGCVAGAGLAYLTGDKDKAVKACMAGAVVGGVASYTAQLKEAREVEAAAKAAGFQAKVTTRQVTAKDGTTEALDGLTITYDAASMDPLTPKTNATLDKLARFTGAAKNELTLTFQGTKNCQVPLRELIKRDGIRNHKVVNECGKSKVNAIVITPLPEFTGE